MKPFPHSQSEALSIGQCAALATLLEAGSPKPGNVHRGADFENLTLYDFLSSGVAISPAMDAAASGAGLGQTVLAAVRATRRLISTNANLGTILLIAPLAMVPRERSLKEGIPAVLNALTGVDAELVYEAIRLADPGGMHRVEQADIHEPAPDQLLEAMRLAAGRDRVAKQYADHFSDLFDFVIPTFQHGLGAGWPLIDVIVRTHVQTMAAFPDSLIARKCGSAIAQQSADYAQKVLDAGVPGEPDYGAALADLDFWLRSDHHRRNPGTTADLIAAAIFAQLRDDQIRLPFVFRDRR